MSRRSAIGALVCALCLWMTAGAQPAPETSPASAGLALNPARWDLGVIGDDAVLSREFELVNRLPREVRIIGVETSCSCNAVVSLPPSLAPGAAASFVVELHPAGKMGRYIWEVKLRTADAQFPLVVLPVNALVQRDALLSEREVRIKPFFLRDEIEAKLSMACRQKPDFHVLSAACNDPGFAVAVTRGPVEGFFGVDRGYEIAITVTPQITPGSKQAVVSITTDIPGRENIELPLHTYVNGYFNVHPKYLAFGVLAPGSTAAKKLKLSHARLGTAFRVLDARTTIADAEIRVTPLILDHLYELEVTWTVPAAEAAGERRGTLEIRTDFAPETALTVPMQGIVLPR